MTGEWIRALGVDYGTVRIGLSVSDDLGMLAHPLKTISGSEGSRPEEEIARIVAGRGINDVVIGLPLHADGRESTMSKLVRQFADGLSKKLDETIRLHLVDEWSTTQTARAKIEASHPGRKGIEEILDQAAAIEILQGWLDKRAGDSIVFEHGL